MNIGENMSTTKKIILAPLLLVIFTIIFIVLNVGMNITGVDQIIQPVTFATTLTICFLFSYYRKYLMATSIVLLILLVFTYLLGILVVSDWVGSLGFGMLVIISFSYLPQFITRGYVEKF